MQRPNLNSKSRLSLRGLLIELAQTLILIIAVYTLINLALPRYKVEGRSMQPVFDGLGEERVMVSRFEYYVTDPQRGDIVVMENPADPQEYFIKRVIGLPNETIRMENGKVYVNGDPLDEPYILDLCHTSRCTAREWVLGEDEFFVLGDNRNNSHDSTAFGAIPRSLIVGRAWMNYWPPAEWRVFEHFDY